MLHVWGGAGYVWKMSAVLFQAWNHNQCTPSYRGSLKWLNKSCKNSNLFLRVCVCTVAGMFDFRNTSYQVNTWEPVRLCQSHLWLCRWPCLLKWATVGPCRLPRVGQWRLRASDLLVYTQSEDCRTRGGGALPWSLNCTTVISSMWRPSTDVGRYRHLERAIWLLLLSLNNFVKLSKYN